MRDLFTEEEYQAMYGLVFRPGYAGYKPEVVEIPNGDGKADTQKRYAHIALKYFKTAEETNALLPFLLRAHARAVQAAQLLELPETWWPRLEYGALRLLDYPPGAGSNLHEDFDLFTLMCYRDRPDLFKSHDRAPGSIVINQLRRVSAQAHLGQIGEAIGLGLATPHEVLPHEFESQRSCVYFAIPDHNNLMPGAAGSDFTVRDWLNKRMARSRTEFKRYE